jgi:hypothetical protein
MRLAEGVSSGGLEIAVVHLVWAPTGARELKEFLAAYRAHTAGVEHRLAVILNGFDGRGDPRLLEVERILEGVDHEQVVMPHSVLDLSAYRHVAEETDAGLLCFLNSYSRPLVDGWLSQLAAPLSRPDVGLTGTGGSYESAYSAAPFWLRRRRRRDFDPFPNPHLRTNGFMLGRELMLDLDWSPLSSKAAAWALESGKHSISRQVWERGLDALVVGRDGHAYACERWPGSATFRDGAQRNLLIADNRTLQYDQADAAMKQRLEQMAWGAAGQSECLAPIRRVNDR